MDTDKDILILLLMNKTKSMRTLFCLFSILIMSCCVGLNAYSQELTIEQKEKITSEIVTAFENSINAAENLDAKLLADCVDDSFQSGFIINGRFFPLFKGVMDDFNGKAIGCKSQELTVINKKITVLGENTALLTTSGDYSLYLEDGRTLTGKFAWTIVYSKINGQWKIVHSHM